GVAHAPDLGGGLELPVGRLDRHVVIPSAGRGRLSRDALAFGGLRGDDGRGLARLELTGRLLDRLHDVHVPGAAAEVAADAVADLRLRRLSVLIEQPGS